jgi:hypothetical protein
MHQGLTVASLTLAPRLPKPKPNAQTHREAVADGSVVAAVTSVVAVAGCVSVNNHRQKQFI